MTFKCTVDSSTSLMKNNVSNHIYSDLLLLVGLLLHTFLFCILVSSKDASTNQPSATTNGQPTTPTDPPTTTTDPPSTTVPPTTPTEPTTTTTKPVYVDCQALLDAGHNKSGVYNITPSQYPDGLEVYCYMNKKGWIVSFLCSLIILCEIVTPNKKRIWLWESNLYPLSSIWSIVAFRGP